MANEFVARNGIISRNNVLVTGSLDVSGSLTSSAALITGDVVVQGTASINTLIINQTQLSTGSNQLGDNELDTQTLYGTVRIPTGSLTVTGSTISTGGFTGSLFGTASYIPTLAQVTTAGNTTTNAITVGLINSTALRAVVTITDTTAGVNNPSYFGSYDNFLQLAVNRNPSTGVYAQTGKASSQISLEGDVGTSSIRFYTTTTNNSTPSERIRIFGNGNVGINTTTDAGFKLDVSGSTRITNGLTVTGSIIGNLTGSFTGSGIIASSSFTSTASYVNPLTQSVNIKGLGSTSATTVLSINNSNSTSSLTILGDGQVITPGPGGISTNTIIGSGANGNDGYNASYRVFLGTGAGYNGSNNYCVAIGYNALYNGGASSCIAIGASAGSNVTLGSDNIAIGYNTLNGASGQQYNIAIGTSALKGAGSSQNIAIGIDSGYSLVDNFLGGKNVLIGYQSGYSLINGRRNLMLGFQAGYSETGNDKLYIANSSTTNPLISGDFSSIKVGINKNPSSLNATLDISGSSIISGSLTVTNNIIGSLTGSFSGSGLIASSSYSSTSSYVNPLTQSVFISGSDSTIPLTVINGPAGSGAWNKTMLLKSTYPTLIFNSNSSKWSGIAYDYSSGFNIWVNASSEDIYSTYPKFSIYNNGNVGINNQLPSYTLDVSGSTRITNGLISSGSTSFSGSVTLDGKMSIGRDAYNTLPSPTTRLQILGPTQGYPTLGTNSGSLLICGDITNYGMLFGVDYNTGNGWITVMRNDAPQAYHLLLQTAGGNVGIGTTSAPTGRLTVKGTGTTSSTTSLLIQDSSTNASLQVLDNNSVKIGRISTFDTGNSALYVGHKTDSQYISQVILDSNKDDNTYYKLVIEQRNSSTQPFQMYTNGVQTWLYGYGSGMQYQSQAMKIPNQISMGTTDLIKSELSGSILFIHGQDFYAQRSYIRLTSYTTGVDTFRGAAMGLWTNDTLRFWNYENTTTDFGVNNIQRFQLTPSGSNITGSLYITSSASTSSAALYIYKSGSSTVDIQGSTGQLFSITDNLTGSLMSVNDVSGLPILEVSSDDKVVMGTYSVNTLVVTGSTVITSGSLRGKVNTVVTASGTASLDCSLGNFFDLTLSGSYTLFLSASNIQPGQTVNLRINQPSTSGSLTYGSQFKFPGGIAYTASSTGSVTDIISFITFDTSTLYGSSIKNLS